MMNKRPTILASAAAILFGLTANVSIAAVNLSCDAYTNSDALMWARYIDNGDRQTFDITVKLPAGKEGLAEQTRPVFVSTENIGSIVLSNNGRTIAKGGLSLGTSAGYSNPGALPPNWPGAGIGTLIRVGNLSCALRG